jgi:acyl carrier protein phosphodiesterase
MIDMFYDHFLAKYWSEFMDEPLREFSARIYSILERRHAMLPDRLQQMAPRMAQWNWLESYAQVGSIHTALDRMGQRLTRQNSLRNSADELVQHYPAFESDFRDFLPQVREFAKSHHASSVD